MGKVYNWYEWFWKNNPCGNAEKEKARNKLIENLITKAEVLQFLGNWQERNWDAEINKNVSPLYR